MKSWSVDSTSIPEKLKVGTNMKEQEGLIREAQRLCSQLVDIIHSDVLSVKSFASSSKSSTQSTVGIMLTCVLAELSACASAASPVQSCLLRVCVLTSASACVCVCV